MPSLEFPAQRWGALNSWFLEKRASEFIAPELDPDLEPPESEFPELEPEEELDAVSEDAFPEFEFPDDESESEPEASPEVGLAAEAEDSTGSPTESLREDALFEPEGFLLA